MEMLKISGLTKRFADKEVLRGIDLCVPEGSIFGFIGKNGAGKTTTMKAVLGLLKADAGEIYVSGEKAEYGANTTNRYIGYLPDVPDFYWYMTAREYLSFSGEITGMSKPEINKRSDELLSLVGLQDEKSRVSGYSRGMKQRLGIAAALLSKPKLLICDEPTSALDPVGRKEILDILCAVKEHTTVLFSTHILSDVERICTDVAFLADGVIKTQGRLADVKQMFASDEYTVELVNMKGAEELSSAFGGVRMTGDAMVSFAEKDVSVYDVMRFVADRKIPMVKIEKAEPSLESLFMEVADK